MNDEPEKKTPLKPEEQEMADDPKKILPAGARGFSVFLFAFAAFFFYHSMKIFAKSPKLSGPGFFPVVLNGGMMLMVVIDFVKDIRKPADNDHRNLGEVIRETSKYLLPKETVVFLIISIVYYILLQFGVPFLPASALFLMASMCYLIPHSTKQNLIYTVVLLAAVYVIFTLVFRISLP